MTDSDHLLRRELVTQRFKADPYIASQGFELDEISATEVALSVTIRADQCNFHGGTHGGVLFSLADSAFGLACNAYEQSAVAIDTHMVFSAPSGKGDRLVATAEEVTRGRTLGTYQAIVTNTENKTVGLFTGTVLILDDADS